MVYFEKAHVVATASKVLEPWKDMLEEPDRPIFTYYDCLTGPPDPTLALI
jgi:hypothetical protein